MDSSGTAQDTPGHDNYGYDGDEMGQRTNSSVNKRGQNSLGISNESVITSFNIASSHSQDLSNSSLHPDNEVSLDGTPAEVREPVETKGSTKSELVYSVDDVPPWYISIVLGFQHFLTMIGSTISIPYILTPLLCIDNSDPTRGKLLCTIIFVSGMVTLLQSTFGIRLPIIQGGTFSFLVPTIAILITNFEPCSESIQQNMTSSEIEEVWQVRMREIQGSIILASTFQVVIGFSGLMGLLLTWITPLTIVPTVTLVGLSLFSVAADKASLHWGISTTTIVLLILFSQYLKEVPVPIPTFKKGSGCTISWFYIFKLFPVLLAILISWGLCAILTVAGVFPEGNKARTDLNMDLINKSPWFRFPYPAVLS